MAAPWLGGASYKELLLDYPNACEILVLTRDRDAGERRPTCLRRESGGNLTPLLRWWEPNALVGHVSVPQPPLAGPGRFAGRVTIDSEGQPCINYTLSKGDEASMMEVCGCLWLENSDCIPLLGGNSWWNCCVSC